MAAVASSQQVWGAVSRYASAVGWLARMLWEAFRWRVVGAMAAAQLGVLVVGVGLSLSLGYLQQLEAGGEFRVLGFVWVARDETTLTAMVGVILVTLLTGGAIVFLAQRQIVAMAAELNHHVRMRLVLAYGGDLPAADWRNERSVWRALWLLQTRDARRTAIVARSLLRNTVNLAVAVAGLAVLVYLDVRMTLLFVVVMAVAMISYYRTNAASARATRRYEDVAPGTRKGLRRLLPSFQTLGQPAPGRAQLAAALDDAAVEEETAAFRDRFGAHIHAELLGFAIMGVALAGLTAFLGRQALAGTIPWTRLIAYLLVLRFTVNAIQSVLRTFAFFSRFYPSIDRLNRFLSASNPGPGEPLAGSLPLHLAADALVEDAHAAAPVAPGEVIELVLPVPLSRYSLGLLAPVFVGTDHERRRRLLGQVAMAAPLRVPPTPVSLRDLVPLDGDDGLERLRARLGAQLPTLEAATGSDPDVAVPGQTWGALPAELLDSLVLAAAEVSGRPVLAVHRRLVDGDRLARVARDGRDRIVVVCSRATPSAPGQLPVSRQVVASPRGQVVAVGSPAWIDRHRDAIGARLEGPAGTSTDSGDDLDDDDEG